MAHRSHVALVYNLTGQTVSFYPPTHEVVADGAPTAAATYKVWAATQSNDDTPKFTGTATLDNTSQTTQNIIGPAATDRTLIQVTSTSGIVAGRRYLLTNSASGSGAQRMVIVPKIVGTTTLNAESDIPVDFVLPCTLTGLRQSFVIDSTFITTQSNINVFAQPSFGYPSSGPGGLSGNSDSATSAPPYRVEWTYATAGGIPRKTWTTFDVCRAPLKHGVSIEHVKASMPDMVWMEWTQQRGAEFYPQIEEAFERVKMDIRAAGYDPNAVSDPQVIDRLVTLAARACIAQALDKDQDGKLEAAYAGLFQKFIGTSLRSWMALGTTGAVSVEPAQQMWLER